MRLTLREITVLALSVLMTVLVVAANNWYVKSRTPRLVTVDMRQVMQAKQRQVSDLLVKEGVTQETRSAAIRSAGDYAAKVDRVLAEIVEDCRCVVISRELVVTGLALDDRTEELMARMRDDLRAGTP
jgi:hypothetical protein